MAKKPKTTGLNPVQMITGGPIVAWRGRATRLYVKDSGGREFQVLIVAREDIDVEVVARRVVGDVFESEKVGEIVCCSPEFFDRRVKT